MASRSSEESLPSWPRGHPRRKDKEPAGATKAKGKSESEGSEESLPSWPRGHPYSKDKGPSGATQAKRKSGSQESSEESLPSWPRGHPYSKDKGPAGATQAKGESESEEEKSKRAEPTEADERRPLARNHSVVDLTHSSSSEEPISKRTRLALSGGPERKDHDKENESNETGKAKRSSPSKRPKIEKQTVIDLTESLSQSDQQAEIDQTEPSEPSGPPSPEIPLADLLRPTLGRRIAPDDGDDGETPYQAMLRRIREFVPPPQGPHTEEISDVNPAADYTVVKDLRGTLEEANMGGRNKGIWVVRRHRDGKQFVRKDFPMHSKFSMMMARKEIAITRGLRHPHVIEFIDAFCSNTVPGRSHLYTEKCDVSSLAVPMKLYQARRMAMPEAFIRHVLHQVAAGLAYMHDGIPLSQFGTAMTGKVAGWLSVIHSDLKSENIFMTSAPGQFYPRVVIGDFGWSIRSDDDHYGNEAQGGSMAVWPPEWPRVVEKSDVWGLAAVLQDACLFDHGPLRQVPPIEDRLAWAARSEAWQPRGAGPGYSRELNQVLACCQIMDPTARASAQEVGFLMRWLFPQHPVPDVELMREQNDDDEEDRPEWVLMAEES